jgi:hypothetical protein
MSAINGDFLSTPFTDNGENQHGGHIGKYCATRQVLRYGAGPAITSNRPDGGLSRKFCELWGVSSVEKGMNLPKCLPVLSMFLLGVTTAFSQTDGPGAIIEQKPCVYGTYEQQSRFTKRFYSKEDYAYAQSSP